MLDHAATLLDDAAILVDARRYERAEFLIATAQEEMGKAYMLIDMARVDLANRQETLHRLCRAFYDHVTKHVYFDLSAHEYAGIWELAHVKDAYRIGMRRWWRAAPESGEPDMPHDTHFLREANLYVDFDSFSGTWAVPHLPSKAMLFESTLPTPLDDARKALAKLQATRTQRLFSAESLRTFNEHMKKLFIANQTATADLLALYQETGAALESALGLAASSFDKSELRNWPLYWITD
jgi:AbiV family abortive infection protein